MANTDLSKGSKEEIKEFQQAMNLLKHTGADGKPLTVDGVWGRNTRAAVKKFQQANNLTPDGIAGVDTVEALVASPQLSNEKPDTVVPPEADSTGGLDQLPSVAPTTTTQGASTASTTPTTTPTTKTEPKPVTPQAQARLDAIKAIQTKRAAQQSAQTRVVKPDPHGEEQAGGVGPQKKIKKVAPQAQVSTNPATIYNRPQNEQYQNKQQAMHVLKQIYKQYKAARQNGDKKTLNALLPRVVSMNTKAQNVYRLNPGIKNLSVKLKNLLDKALTESYNNINEGLWDDAKEWMSDTFSTDELPGGKEEAEYEYNGWGFASTDTGIKIVEVPSGKGSELKLMRGPDTFKFLETIPWSYVEKFVKSNASLGYRKIFAKMLSKAPKQEPIQKRIANLPEELKQQAFEIRDTVVKNISDSIKSLGFNQENVPSDNAESHNQLGQTIEKTQTLLNNYQKTAEHDDLVATVESYNELVANVQQYANNPA